MKTNSFRKYASAPSIKARVWRLICKNINEQGFAELSYADFIKRLHLSDKQKTTVQKAIKLLIKDGHMTKTKGWSYQKTKFFPTDGVKDIRNPKGT